MTIETQNLGEPVTKSGPYNGNGVTASFDYEFQIQAEEELLVTRLNADDTETVLTLTTDYTVSGVGADTGGSITLLDPATDLPSQTQIVLQYNGDFNQETDYSNQGAIQLGELEDALDKITMHLRSLKEQVDRSVKVNAFNTTDLQTLVTNLAALGAITSEISTLAAISSDVTTVAGITSEVTAVAAVAAEVAIVAANISAVTAVAAVDSEVTALSALTTEIAALGAISGDIASVASIAAHVTTVAGISSDVTSVAGIAANVTTVAGLSTETAALAALSTEIADLGAITSEISTVAGIAADVTALVTNGGGTLTGNWTASGVWDFTSTEALRLPVGTDAQRPSTPAKGDTRFNDTSGELEIYDGSAWASAGGGGGIGRHTVWFGGSASIAAVTDGAQLFLQEDSSNNLTYPSFDFASGTEENIQAVMALPKSYDGGTIFVRFYWLHEATTVNFGVAFGVKAVALGEGDDIGTAFGTEVVVTDTGGVTDQIYRTSTTSAITVANSPAGEKLLALNIARKVGNAGDTLAIDAKMLGFEVFYTTNAATDD